MKSTEKRETSDAPELHPRRGEEPNSKEGRSMKSATFLPNMFLNKKEKEEKKKHRAREEGDRNVMESCVI